MEIRGRIVVITVFVVAIGLSVAAWRHNYVQTDQSARFWGRERALLLLRSPQLELLTLANRELDRLKDDDEAEGEGKVASSDVLAANWLVVDSHDLSNAPGLIHFRHALTYDDNYLWNERSAKATEFDAAYALRFSDGKDQLVLLFPDGFTEMGRLEDNASRVTILPCPKMASALTTYLREVGAIAPQATSEEQ